MSIPLGYFSGSTTPTEVSGSNIMFSEIIMGHPGTIITTVVQISIIIIFFWTNRKGNIGKYVTILRDRVDLLVSVECIIYLGYLFINGTFEDKLTFGFLTYFAFTYGDISLLISVLVAIEGISENICKKNYYSRCNDIIILFCGFIVALSFVAFSVYTGPVLIKNIFESCIASTNCTIVLSHYSFKLFCLTHILAIILFVYNVKVMDYRHVKGGNFKRPAQYNKERDEALKNIYNYLLNIAVWFMYFFFIILYGHAKYSMYIANLFLAIRPFIQQLLLLFLNNKECFSFYLRIVLQKRSVVRHERHRRRNRIQAERAARMAENQCVLELQQPLHPVADSDSNDVGTWV